MEWKIKRALIISAHTDDMELGAGGTARKMVEAGIEVTFLVFSDCRKSIDTSRFPIDALEKECKAAALHIGINDVTILQTPVREFPTYRQDILEKIYEFRKEKKPDLVISTWYGDLHQDHKVVAEETRRAFMKTDTGILSYEVPGNCPGFTPQVFIPLTQEEVDKKIEMLQLYKSQVARRGYFEINAIKSLMGYQGNHIGYPYAEAFVQERGFVESFGT